MELIKVKQGKRLQSINHEYDHFMKVFQVTDRPENWANGYKIRLNGELVVSKNLSDCFHYDSGSQIIIGERIGNAMLDLLKIK